MNLKIITPPATEPLNLTEAKQMLRVDGSADDTMVSSLIKQAMEYCEDYQGKKYITQTIEGYLDEFSCSIIEFRDCSPVQSITSIKYTDKDGIETTLDASNYILDNVSFVNKIDLAYGKSWPTATLKPVNGIKITFVSGCGDAAAVSDSVKWAMVCHMRILGNGILFNLRPEDITDLKRVRDSLLGMGRVVPV